MTLHSVACLAFMLFGASEAKLYSTNAICRQFNCINPIFPGVEDLRRLEATQLQCQPHHDAKPHMQFCKNAVNYDVALPSPKKSGNKTTLESVVMLQDNAASTMFYYHLAGMNVEAWEHRHPEEGNDLCTQAVWKMVCNTYFPRAEAGCKKGEATKHLRPCKNVCGSYLQACSVECCDESVQCVFEKKVSLVGKTNATTVTGYHDELGPSAMCTGASFRKSYPSVGVLGLAVLAFLQFMLPGHRSQTVASASTQRKPSQRSANLRKYAACFMLFAVCTTLQGCSLGEVFSHPTPSWENVASYWEKFQYIPEGEPASKKVYNSCELNLPAHQQCSGNGECEAWRPGLKATGSGNPTKFCKCYRDWADPECRTQRKSQMSAFFLSVFFGFFGADQFYLQFYIAGCCKLALLSGVMACWWLHGWWVLNILSYAGVFWWVFDIVRIGSAPIYSAEYRCAYDLPHWFFVTFTITFFTLLGYFFFGAMTRADRFQKAKQNLLMKEDEMRQKTMAAEANMFAEDTIGMPTLRSHSVPIPHNYGAVPDAVRQGAVFTDKGQPEFNRYSPYGILSHAMQYHNAHAAMGGVDGRANVWPNDPNKPNSYFGY